MNEKPKNKPSKSRKWLIGFGLLLLTCFLSVWAILFLLTNTLIVHAGEKAFGVASQMFDASANWIQHIHYYSWQPQFRYLHFEGPNESIQSWLENFCFEDFQENPASHAFRNDLLIRWWKPQDALYYTVSECGEDPHYEILIDQSNAELWILYLVISE